MSFKNICATVLLSLSIFGCSPSTQQVPPQKPRACEFTPKQFLSGYVVDLPTDWTIDKQRVSEDNSDVTRELVATSPNMLGRIPVVITIFSTSYDGTPDEFAAGMVVSLLHSNAKVIAADVIKIEDRYATITMYVLETGFLTIQMHIASDVKGYIVACAGDPEKGKELLKICTSAMDTFQLTK